MTTTFLNLPAPAANGAGAAVDVSGLGANKTIVNGGNGSSATEPFVTIEISCDAGAANWFPIHTFQAQQNEVTIAVPCHFMRAVVSNYQGGGAPAVDVGAEDDAGVTFATLVAPAGDGAGAGVATDALDEFKTIEVTGSFGGTVNIQISENAGVNWKTVASFSAPGVQRLAFTAQQMRVFRVGVSLTDPGLPLVDIAAGAPEGASGIEVAAGSQTAATGTVLFADSNGYTFGMSGSSQVTLSGDAFRSIIGAGSTATGPLFSFRNTNGVTFGLSGQTLTASVQTVGGTATGVAISAGTEVATTGAVVFSNSNNITFGLNAQTLTATFAGIKSISGGTTRATNGEVVFSNSNNLSFGVSGNTVTASFAYKPGTIVGFTATGGETAATVTFAPALANTSYSVFAQLNGVASIFGIDCPAGTANRSVSAFKIEPTASMVSGDQIAFWVQPV